MKQVEVHWFSLQCGEKQTDKSCQNHHEPEWGHTKLGKSIRFELGPHWKWRFANWNHWEDILASNSTTLMPCHHLVSAFDLHWYCTWCKSWLKFSHDAAAASSKKLRCCICQKFRMERNFWISMKCQLCTAIGSKGRWKVFSSTFQQGILSQAW